MAATAKSPGIAFTVPTAFQAHRRPRICVKMLIEAARRRNAHNGAVTGKHNRFIRRFSRSRCDGTENLFGTGHGFNRACPLEPRQALIVRAGFLEGLKSAEISSLIGVSEATILRDWRAAKVGWGKSSSGGVIGTLGG